MNALKACLTQGRKVIFKMKKLLLCLILLTAMGASGCSAPVPKTVTEDGGVTRQSTGKDAPKTIKSDEIVSFSCELSFIASVFEEENELEGRVYKLSAVSEGDTVKAKIDWRDRYGDEDKAEFTTDISFMKELQDIVSRYGFAQHNGYSYYVSGLPDMYGECIDIKYASGESIYAEDNQSGFLPQDAVTELIDLFTLKKGAE